MVDDTHATDGDGEAVAVRRQLRITCADAVSLMTEHLEAALSPSDRERMSSHLAGCEACAVYLDQLRVTVTVVGHLAGEDDFAVAPAVMDDLVDRFSRTRG